MQIGSRRSQRGFTLIELLMVILIIGLLAALGTRAAFSALQAAKRAAILVEISQMDQAMAAYKSRANTFPPCMGDLNPLNTSPTPKGNRFYTHVIRCFPRYIPADLDGNGLRNYLDIRQQVLNNFGGTATKYYDLDTMDQAESLVFWLSGFPTPKSGGSSAGNLLGASKYMGFCTSPTAPFFDTIGKPMGVFASAGVLNAVDTTVVEFQFDQGRLVDQDGDGWLEYIPMGTSGAALIPPYVYFDSDLYTQQANATAAVTYQLYPAPASAGVSAAGPSGVIWGIAAPYAAAMPATQTTQLLWANARKFQIICAGLDNNYGLYGAPIPNYTTLPKVYPTGQRYDMNGADLDNLTNFSDGRQLGDAQ